MYTSYFGTLTGVANGLAHIHAQGVLHNDLKSDNIVLTDCTPAASKSVSQKLWPIIVDFSKACPEDDGKTYHLQPMEIKQHKKCYPHLAPDLVDGKVKQSTASDVYSFGRVVQKLSTLSTASGKDFSGLSALCTTYTDSNRQKLHVTISTLQSWL